jgi:HD-GYP domain-containing protein (c-di-GMP phosphodiesterase class II)
MESGSYLEVFGGRQGINSILTSIGKVPIPAPLLNALEQLRSRDYTTYHHSLTVFALTTLLLQISYMSRTFEKKYLLIGPTHDLGKLSIPLEVLNKKTPLTREERDLLEFHPVAGYVLLSYYLGDHQHPAATIALNHHERCDGSGYPRGITNIEPLVEMVAICDVYDALISPRPYRVGIYDNRTALEELSDLTESGALNRYYVQALISGNRKGHPDPEMVDISTERRGQPPEKNCYGQFEPRKVFKTA